MNLPRSQGSNIKILPRGKIEPKPRVLQSIDFNIPSNQSSTLKKACSPALDNVQRKFIIIKTGATNLLKQHPNENTLTATVKGASSNAVPVTKSLHQVLHPIVANGSANLLKRPSPPTETTSFKRASFNAVPVTKPLHQVLHPIVANGSANLLKRPSPLTIEATSFKKTCNEVPVVTIPKPPNRKTPISCEDGTFFQVPPLPTVNRSLLSLPKNDKEHLLVHVNQSQSAVPAKKVTSPEILEFHQDRENNNTPDPVVKPRSKLSLKKKPRDVSINATNDSANNQGDLNHKEILLAMLPHGYDHKIVAIEPMMPYHKNIDYDQSEMFTATIRVNLRSKEEACQWFENFKESSFSDWRVRRTQAENTKCIIFKKGYRCTHNTLNQYRKGPAATKHTECAAFLSITVKNFAMKRSADKLLSTFPCEIIVHHTHNHPIMSCDTLRHRRPTPKTEKIFLDMFKSNHSPSSALATHKYDLQVNHPENWFEILADGAECPNLQWCYHLYRKTFQEEYGAPSGEAMVDSQLSAVEKYNTECGSTCALAQKFQDSDLIVVICSPLMKRVHQYLKSSGEVNFLDSGGMMDRHNTRVFTFLAPSVAGALPLGLIMTSTESEAALVEGIRMLKSIMPTNAFFGRGPSRGPQVIMTDDSTSERNALKLSFPGIVLLLCLFHILTAFWRYVWESKHKVSPQDKDGVYDMFSQWCYSKTKEEFEKRYNDMLHDPRVALNQFLVKQLKGLCARAPEWALWYRSELLIRGNNTNNYSERTIRGYKDELCFRLRAYSVVQLFDFFTSRLEAYFERKIAAVLNNRKENYSRSKHFIHPSKVKALQCFEGSRPNCFVVKNVEKKTQYYVNMDIEICSCPVGFNGAPCKHQFAVSEKFNLSTSQFLPYEDEQAKAVLHQIMTTVAAKSGWYAPLKSGPLTAKVADSVEAIFEGNPVDVIEETLEDTPTNSTISKCQDSADLETQSAEMRAEVMDLWSYVKEVIDNGLEDRPDTFCSAVWKFASTFKKGMTLSENAALSGLHNFTISSFGSKALRQGRYININRAAAIRRKYAMLGGRKAARQGRPPKSAFTSEHGYFSGTKTTKAAWDKLTTQSKGAVPHCLSERIRQQTDAFNKKKK